MNLCPLPWQADSYPLYHQGSLLHGFFGGKFVELYTLRRWALFCMYTVIQ